MNGWLIAALTVAGVALMLGAARLVGGLFVVDPFPEDSAETEQYEALRSALGGQR